MKIFKYIFDTFARRFSQFYIGIYMGILFGLGFSDWRKIDIESKITEWIMSLCTIGILFGTIFAAYYAKKSANYSRVQMKLNALPKLKEFIEIDNLLGKLQWKYKYISIQASYLSTVKISESYSVKIYCDNIERTFSNKSKMKMPTNNNVDEIIICLMDILRNNKLNIEFITNNTDIEIILDNIDTLHTNVLNLLHHYNEFKSHLCKNDDFEQEMSLSAIKDVAKDIEKEFVDFQTEYKKFHRHIKQLYAY